MVVEGRYLSLGFLGLLWGLDYLTLSLTTGLMLMVFLVTGGHHTLYLAWHTLPRDLRGALRYLKLLFFVYQCQKRNVTVPKAFSRVAAKHPTKPALLYENTSWSFGELERYSNRVANYLVSRGYGPGDCVAIFMENRPEYVAVWLGCTKVGVLPALINSNLQGNPLIHSIKSASAQGLIYGTELAKAVCDVQPQLGQGLHLFYSTDSVMVTSSDSSCDVTNNSVQQQQSVILKEDSQPRHIDFDSEIRKSSPDSPPKHVTQQLKFTDKLLYIYTSGTTGLPKAAVIKHSRFYFYCAGMYYLNNLGSFGDLRVYDPLPLYHSAGGVVGIGLMMVFGSTVAIRKKFSVRNFWKDCVNFNCNGAQYIGEICRYLLSAPETPEEKRHSVQIMFGNGLRPQIWEQFTQRFAIPRIGEFYGATEGNSNVLNIDSKPGSVGFASVLFPFVYPVRLIRVDENGDVVRDAKTGCAVVCKPGETGEFVGKIVKNHPSRGFDGYVDKAATEKKICNDVLRKGDMWFRSGDLLNMDQFGWMYFVDRMGDTYRWRGENVSTIEVEAVLSNVLNQQDTIVYGVEVPGVEGRAGMAAIVEPSGGLDLKTFLSAIKNQLPSYATPIFIRFVQHLDITGTFKIKKMDLQREGFNPHVIEDRMFFYDVAKGAYRQLDACLYNDIVEMRCRL